MRLGDQRRAKKLDADLQRFSATVTGLPGIAIDAARSSFIEQILESIRRIAYISIIRQRDIHPERADPSSELFDPLKAALLRNAEGEIDEAFWLTFLSVHFGRHLIDGWQLTRDIYGGDGNAESWTWNNISNNTSEFRSWLGRNELRLKNDGTSRRFGNHRKYESLRNDSTRGTAAVFDSYIHWIGRNRGHLLFLRDAQNMVGGDPGELFHYLYESMQSVTAFGRTGRFDYLTMIGKLGLAPIEPSSPYLTGATGPLRGARLLFGGNADANLGARYLDNCVVVLGRNLGLGMQVLEDSLCNWQKSPILFVPFRG
jgi:hypothetical protein